MAAKITAKNPADQSSRPAGKSLGKKPAVKPAAEKPVRKVRESKPGPKGRLPKGGPDLSATPTPAKTKVSKPKALKFRDLWKENVSDIKTYVNNVFHTDDDARIYIDYAEGLVSNIHKVDIDILADMRDNTKLDVDRAYRRALISFNLSQLSADQMGIIQSLYSQQSIKNWMDESANPSEETLEHLEERGIYLCAGSKLAMDEFQQPPIAPKTPKYSEGDDIFEIFTQRDLERAPNLANDYEHNINNLDFSDYEKLGKVPAFRAMIELWPRSFRHYANAHAHVKDLTWTFIFDLYGTEQLRAVVSSERVEVVVGTEQAGYSMFAQVNSLEEGVERVFSYFDILSTDGLDGMLKTVGFKEKYVAGMRFDVMADRVFNPMAFLQVDNEPSVEIYHDSTRLTAAKFLLLAAQTTRGVYFERHDTVGNFDEYDLHVDDMKFRVLYMDNEFYQHGEHRGVGSLRGHSNNLSAEQELSRHGIYVDAQNVMHLPISSDAEEVFQAGGRTRDEEHFYMHTVTFV